MYSLNKLLACTASRTAIFSYLKARERGAWSLQGPVEPRNLRPQALFAVHPRVVIVTSPNADFGDSDEEVWTSHSRVVSPKKCMKIHEKQLKTLQQTL